MRKLFLCSNPDCRRLVITKRKRRGLTGLCRPCYAKKWRDELTPERKRAYAQKWLSNPLNKKKDLERGRENSKQWHARRRELGLGRTEAAKRAGRKYFSSPHGKLDHQLRENARRANVNRTPKSIRFTIDDYLVLAVKQKLKCYYCGKKKKLTVDHMVPLCRGGLHTINNIVLACLGCNLKKGKKDAAEFTAVTIGAQ